MENPNQPQINPNQEQNTNPAPAPAPQPQNPNPNPEAYVVPSSVDESQKIASVAKNIVSTAMPQPNTPQVQPNMQNASKPKPKTSRTPQLGMGCLVFGVIFGILMIIGTILIMIQGNGDNSFTQSLGIRPAQFKEALEVITSLIFGFASLGLLILTVVLAFKRTVIPAIEKELRKKALKNIIVSAILLVFTIVVWIFAIYFINQIKVSTTPVNVIQNVGAVITTSPKETTATVPFQIRFDAENSYSNLGKIVKYTWDFGDGSALQIGRSVTRKYTKGGNYTVTLTIEDETGEKATSNINIVAQSPAMAPNAKITTDQEIKLRGNIEYIQGTVPYSIELSGKKSTDQDNNIVYYGWDFDGDENADMEGETIEYTFETPGTYDAVLTVIDADDQASTDILEIIVLEDSLRPHIETTPDITTGPAPFTVSFDASASEYENGDILSYEWDFADGTQPMLADAQVTHIFNVVGEYNVKMTVYTDDNKEATTTQRVIVRNVPLKAKITPSLAHGPAPFKVTFDPSESTGSIRGYAWDFGDNTSSTQSKPTHTYEKPGEYEITLTITDNSNNIASTTYTVTVDEE